MVCEFGERLREWFVGNPSSGEESGRWLDSDPVVHRRRNPLGATKVAFCSLDRDVAKKELNLLQFAASGTAERNFDGDRAVRVW